MCSVHPHASAVKQEGQVVFEGVVRSSERKGSEGDGVEGSQRGREDRVELRSVNQFGSVALQAQFLSLSAVPEVLEVHPPVGPRGHRRGDGLVSHSLGGRGVRVVAATIPLLHHGESCREGHARRADHEGGLSSEFG